MKLPLNDSDAKGQQFINLGSDIAATILRTVEAGWALACRSTEVDIDIGEVELTEHLRDGMRIVLDSACYRWFRTMVVLPGTESRSHPKVMVPDGRTDIPILWIEIFLRFREHDPHAIIECKRIAGTNARLCREYVVEGVDRFRTGKYSRKHSAGFMIGYLIGGDEQKAADGINDYLDSKSRSKENLKPSDLVAEPWAWASNHPRDSTSPIDLHHAFLAFTAA
ncbi:MAG: hypothetical protein OXU79_17865 [Gemmatimonadota bacterium]|nr:hypothetical protein [Gemmatimonadota bacterium]